MSDYTSLSKNKLVGKINGMMKILDSYDELRNLPSINGVELKDALSLDDLGISCIVTKDYLYEFPNVGQEKDLYVAREENKIYRWDEEELKYYSLTSGSDYTDIKIIDGGNA